MVNTKKGSRKLNFKDYLASGFTLIELIVVMAVIGGMGAIFISTFPAGGERARDTHRRSDLKQYQTALETYANKHGGLYPIETANDIKPSALCVAGGALDGFTGCTDDPKDGESDCSSETCEYHYQTDATGTEYSLWAALERPPEPTELWFVACSNGVTNEGATEPDIAVTLCP